MSSTDIPKLEFISRMIYISEEIISRHGGIEQALKDIEGQNALFMCVLQNGIIPCTIENRPV